MNWFYKFAAKRGNTTPGTVKCRWLRIVAAWRADSWPKGYCLNQTDCKDHNNAT